MTLFRYKAYNERGILQAGNVEAATREAALEILARGNRLATELVEADTMMPQPWWSREAFHGRQLKPAALAMFTRELSTLSRAALTIDESLRIIALQPLLTAAGRKLAADLEGKVVAGGSLSEALASHGAVFPAYYARLVRAGEASGALTDTLEQLADFIDQSTTLGDRIRSALLYPAILLIAAAVSLGVIVAVLVPAVAPLFEDAGVTTPITIAALHGLYKFAASYWAFLVLLGTVAAGALYWGLRSPLIWRPLDQAILHLPIGGNLVRRRETARLARTLAVLQRGGLPILDALDIAATVPANGSYREAVKRASIDVAEGMPLSESFARSNLFSDVAIRLISIGEKTGRLWQMLERLAVLDETILRRDLDRLTALIGPFLTIAIGLLVGGLVLSVLSAVVAVNDLAFR